MLTSRVLKRFDCPGRNKRERDTLLRYLQHTSGYSRAQITRLIAQWQAIRLAPVPLTRRYRSPAAPFSRKCTSSDIEQLVEMDKANDDVCGQAIAHLLQRAYSVYGDECYERLARLSSHLVRRRFRLMPGLENTACHAKTKGQSRHSGESRDPGLPHWIPGRARNDGFCKVHSIQHH